MIYCIRHKVTRSQQVVLGSSVIALDTEGIAEVPKDVYENVAGLKNWEQLEVKEGESKFAEVEVPVAIIVSAESKTETHPLDTIKILNSRIAELEGQVIELSDRNEKLLKEVDDLRTEKFRLETLIGIGKTLEEVLPNGNEVKRIRERKIA